MGARAKNAVLAASAALAGILSFHVPETIVLRSFSAASGQVTTIDSDLAHADGKDILLIGDSTVRCMQPSPTGFDPDRRIVNLGAGGTKANVWRYVLLRALRTGKQFKRVVFAMTGGGTSMLSRDRISPYYPFLMSWGDVYEAYLNGRFDLKEGPRFISSMLAPLIVNNDDVLFMAGQNFYHPLGQFLAGVGMVTVRPDWAMKASQEELDLMAILEIARNAGLPVTFVNSPSSAAIRSSAFAAEGREKFKSLCLKYELRCKDLSAALPDDHFGFDGVHVSAQLHDSFRSLIKAAADE